MKLDPYLTQYTKISSLWIVGLTVRAKTVKLSEENIAIHFYALRLGNGFLYTTPKAQVTEQISKRECDYIKIKSFLWYK